MGRLRGLKSTTLKYERWKISQLNFKHDEKKHENFSHNTFTISKWNIIPNADNGTANLC